ncbi:MAG TPA: DUF465 domain-containing protein [Gammaproteobacteria bacterium]|nr:DUF465 domain-containing protein [Gammaproteobacteria bacterium]
MDLNRSDSLRDQLRSLKHEHHTLDATVNRLARNPAVDPFEVRRLKKRKLRLKDEIEQLQSRLQPDGNA